MKETGNSISNIEVLTPRMEHDGKSPKLLDITNDKAVQLIAKMVVAGVDKQYSEHPIYQAYIERLGRLEAESLIDRQVNNRGANDMVQTWKIVDGAAGLYGGLSKDGRYFEFHEWMPHAGNQMSVIMNPEEARQIVKGEKTEILFYPKNKSSY